MNRRSYWDDERGMTVINRSPNARRYPTPEEVKGWIATGAMTFQEADDDELLRCPSCGRAAQCECPDCPFCCNGMPMAAVNNSRKPSHPTGTE